jgi:hypothetical protein
MERDNLSFCITEVYGISRLSDFASAFHPFRTQYSYYSKLFCGVYRFYDVKQLSSDTRSVRTDTHEIRRKMFF